jgi:hypothetical protein
MWNDEFGMRARIPKGVDRVDAAGDAQHQRRLVIHFDDVDRDGVERDADRRRGAANPDQRCD